MVLESDLNVLNFNITLPLPRTQHRESLELYEKQMTQTMSDSLCDVSVSVSLGVSIPATLWVASSIASLLIIFLEECFLFGSMYWYNFVKF